MPPWVDRIRNSRPVIAAASQPMPAFWLQPNRSPDGRSRSISAVNGSAPDGPGTRVATSNSARSWESKGFRVMRNGKNGKNGRMPKLERMPGVRIAVLRLPQFERSLYLNRFAIPKILALVALFGILGI